MPSLATSKPPLRSRALRVDRSDPGPLLLLAGSDYPHPEGLADPHEFADELVGLDVASQQRIMRDNAATMLGLAV